MDCRRRLKRWGLLAVLLLALSPSSAGAQYFGRNKVQYESFNFKLLSTQHFDIYFYEDERRMAVEAGRMAERWYNRISHALAVELEGRQPLILYASHPDFEQTNAISGELDEGTGGVTESFKRRIVLPLAGSLAETDHVIGHELVHAFQYDLQRRSSSNPLDPGAQLPLWFIEGMAEYLSVGPLDPNTAMWIRDASLSGKMPTIAKLDQPQYFPYRFGQALWAFVASRFGEESVGRVLKSATGKGVGMEQAFQFALGWNTDSLSREWLQAVKPWAEHPGTGRDTSGDGKVLVGARGQTGRLNIAPSISPDGRRLAFLSERDQFSIELYLADIATRKVVRRLTRAAVDPHLQSLQFIHSAGGWSRDGKRLAISIVRGGKPSILIIDPESGKTLQRISLPRLGEIFNPTWSPDGRRVAFSAIAGGVTDLFVVNLGTLAVERLTDDLYSDLQPSWSPDGRSLAFSTDRFTTRLDELKYGNQRLAILDLETRAIRAIPGADEGKNINPQWSPDGTLLYFLSDRTGVSNVYRIAATGGVPSQITDLATGVSGITGLSPALSVARDADRLVYGSFGKGSYHLHLLEAPGSLGGVAPRTVAGGAGLLPSADSLVMAASTAVRDSGSLADTVQFSTSRYRPGLTLDHASQTSLGMAAGSGGLSVGGGTALYWSDMLGNHNLATIFQLSSSEGGIIRNLGALVGYENRAQRLNYGVQAYQIPYFTRAFQSEPAYIGGQPVVIERDFRTWQIERAFEASFFYPVNRSQRLELSAGVRNISFEEEVRTLTYDANTGLVLSDVTRPGPGDSIPPLDLVMTSVATSYDNSLFGGTSPIQGQRYRLELAPVVGDLQFVSVLADFRRYQKIAGPLTLATRALHLGRYGRDSESWRISDLFIGYPWLVRGYDSPSFLIGEQETYNLLFGSRTAVGNVELRMPLIGGVGLIRAVGVPPIELAAFYDVGAAWTEAYPAHFLGGFRPAVSSYGTSFRFNLFGFAVAEFAYVHPNDRPIKGWYWQFNLEPGF